MSFSISPSLPIRFKTSYTPELFKNFVNRHGNSDCQNKDKEASVLTPRLLNRQTPDFNDFERGEEVKAVDEEVGTEGVKKKRKRRGKRGGAGRQGPEKANNNFPEPSTTKTIYRDENDTESQSQSWSPNGRDPFPGPRRARSSSSDHASSSSQWSPRSQLRGRDPYPRSFENSPPPFITHQTPTRPLASENTQKVNSLFETHTLLLTRVNALADHDVSRELHGYLSRCERNLHYLLRNAAATTAERLIEACTDVVALVAARVVAIEAVADVRDLDIVVGKGVGEAGVEEDNSVREEEAAEQIGSESGVGKAIDEGGDGEDEQGLEKRKKRRRQHRRHRRGNKKEHGEALGGVSVA